MDKGDRSISVNPLISNQICYFFILNEDKQTRNLVSFDSANFEMSEIYEANVQF